MTAGSQGAGEFGHAKSAIVGMTWCCFGPVRRPGRHGGGVVQGPVAAAERARHRAAVEDRIGQAQRASCAVQLQMRVPLFQTSKLAHELDMCTRCEAQDGDRLPFTGTISGDLSLGKAGRGRRLHCGDGPEKIDHRVQIIGAEVKDWPAVASKENRGSRRCDDNCSAAALSARSRHGTTRSMVPAATASEARQLATLTREYRQCLRFPLGFAELAHGGRHAEVTDGCGSRAADRHVIGRGWATS